MPENLENLISAELGLMIFVAAVGLALHIAMKWREARAQHADHEQHSGLGFRAYVRLVPAQTAVAVLASIGSFTVAWAVEWLNPGMAFACGYMGSSIAENMAGKFAQGAGR